MVSSPEPLARQVQACSRVPVRSPVQVVRRAPVSALVSLWERVLALVPAVFRVRVSPVAKLVPPVWASGST
jgi:hypothetical protein